MMTTEQDAIAGSAAPVEATPNGHESPSAVDEFVIEPLRNMWDAVVAHLPQVATALVVLIVLYIVARLARTALQRVLGLSRVDRALEETRLSSILNAFQKGLKPSSAIAYLVYLAVILLAWLTAADIVGLTAVRVTLESILAYLPNLVSALLVIAFGGWLASLARRAVSAAMQEVQSPYARILEGLTEFLLMIVVVSVALNVLGIDVSIVTQNLTILVATVAVTVSFLFAWSMRRPAEQIIANYYARRMLRIGDRVRVGDTEGVIGSFTPIGILVRDDEGVEHFMAAKVVVEAVRRLSRSTVR